MSPLARTDTPWPITDDGIWLEVRAAANAERLPVCVVTNQSGIDRGLYGWDAFAAVERRIDELLAAAGAAIDARAPRIHGELLMPGIEISQSTVSKVMVRHLRPPSQTWRTFLANHADGLASIDPFVVPTAPFRLLYAVIVLRHERRKVVHFDVTSHPMTRST